MQASYISKKVFWGNSHIDFFFTKEFLKSQRKRNLKRIEILQNFSFQSILSIGREGRNEEKIFLGQKFWKPNIKSGEKNFKKKSWFKIFYGKNFFLNFQFSVFSLSQKKIIPNFSLDFFKQRTFFQAKDQTCEVFEEVWREMRILPSA